MANLQIAGGAYSIKAPIAVQECINLYPEVEISGQEKLILRRFPGLKLFSAMGATIRGMERMAGTLYVVAGTTLYSVSGAGVSTSLGTIVGTNPVSMANDGTNLVIVNGTSTGYVYNGTLSTITDTDFLSADRVFYLDTYFVFQRSDTNQFFISESGSATSFIGTDFASKEGQPGDIVTLFVSHRDLLLFGTDTLETWRNTGNPDFPFQRMEGTFQERGAIGVNCPAEMDNSVYFLGDDKIVYTLQGYRPVRISHHAIESWLKKQNQPVLDDVKGFSITFEGHYWYILSFSTGTWVYDSTVSNMIGQHEWFQLKSWNQDNWRVTHSETCYGKILCGGDGNIYELDPGTYNENGNIQLKQRVTPYYHNNRMPVSCPRLELGFEQGVANSSVTDPQVMLEISRDWGRTWGNRRQRSMGLLGEYNEKAVWRRNGHARGFVFKWYVTDDVDVTFTGGYGKFTSGAG